MVSSLMACRIRLTWPTLVTPRSLRSRLVNVNSSLPRMSCPWNASVYSDSCKESNQAHTSATPQLATSRPAPLAFSLRSFQKIPRPPRPPFRSWNKVHCIVCLILQYKFSIICLCFYFIPSTFNIWKKWISYTAKPR